MDNFKVTSEQNIAEELERAIHSIRDPSPQDFSELASNTTNPLSSQSWMNLCNTSNEIDSQFSGQQQIDFLPGIGSIDDFLDQINVDSEQNNHMQDECFSMQLPLDQAIFQFEDIDVNSSFSEILCENDNVQSSLVNACDSTQENSLQNIGLNSNQDTNEVRHDIHHFDKTSNIQNSSNNYEKCNKPCGGLLSEEYRNLVGGVNIHDKQTNIPHNNNPPSSSFIPFHSIQDIPNAQNVQPITVFPSLREGEVNAGKSESNENNCLPFSLTDLLQTRNNPKQKNFVNIAGRVFHLTTTSHDIWQYTTQKRLNIDVLSV